MSTATKSKSSKSVKGLVVSGEGLRDRNDWIKAIRNNLKIRSGKSWSVTGGKGTAYGWIKLASPPRRMVDGWKMPEEDTRELADLLGLSRPVHYQGETIPDSSAYYIEYLKRSAGVSPKVHGTPYWD